MRKRAGLSVFAATATGMMERFLTTVAIRRGRMAAWAAIALASFLVAGMMATCPAVTQAQVVADTNQKSDVYLYGPLQEAMAGPRTSGEGGQ